VARTTRTADSPELPIRQFAATLERFHHD